MWKGPTWSQFPWKWDQQKTNLPSDNFQKFQKKTWEAGNKTPTFLVVLLQFLYRGWYKRGALGDSFLHCSFQMRTPCGMGWREAHKWNFAKPNIQTPSNVKDNLKMSFTLTQAAKEIINKRLKKVRKSWHILNAPWFQLNCMLWSFGTIWRIRFQNFPRLWYWKPKQGM